MSRAASSCPLTDGPAGALTGTFSHVTSSSATAQVAQSSLATGAVSCVAASSSLTTSRVGFVIDSGAALTTGVAAERRVGLGFGETAVRRLRPGGWVVFDNAVEWALA